MNISVCGIDCDIAGIECNKNNEEFFIEPCKGCNAVEGRIFWTQYLGLDTCPIYHCCVDEKQLAHCGQCTDLPCEIYFNTKDPSIPDDIFKQKIYERTELLKKL